MNEVKAVTSEKW